MHSLWNTVPYRRVVRYGIPLKRCKIRHFPLTTVCRYKIYISFAGNHILDIDSCVRNDADHHSLNKLKVRNIQITGTFVR
jgi:hypothetical protein